MAAFLTLPFAWAGTVLLHVLPFMLLAATSGVIAWSMDLSMDPQVHELLGFVIGFLLIVLGNFSHANYDKAVATMNKAVQDGTNLYVAVVGLLQAESSADMQELREFRVVPRRIIRKICHRWIMWIVPWYLDCEGPRCKGTAMLLLREKITHPNLNGEGNAF